MRRLTFPGFLRAYVRALSGEDTLSLARLSVRSLTEPRLVEPLLLWVVVTGRTDALSAMLEGREALQRELGVLEHLRAEGRLEAELAADHSTLRPEYRKAWRSFLARRDAPQRDRDLRLAARAKVLELESRKSVTRYRMAKDLGLNPGNLHAFLSQADPTKLSVDRVAALLRYLEAA